jgi:hypothetical protein
VVPRTLVFRESPQEYKCGLLFHQVYEKWQADLSSEWGVDFGLRHLGLFKDEMEPAALDEYLVCLGDEWVKMSRKTIPGQEDYLWKCLEAWMWWYIWERVEPFIWGSGYLWGIRQEKTGPLIWGNL